MINFRTLHSPLFRNQICQKQLRILAGVDILCDGGCTAGKKLKQKLSIS